MESLIHSHSTLWHSHVSDQVANITGRRGHQQIHVQGAHWFYHAPQHLEATGLHTVVSLSESPECELVDNTLLCCPTRCTTSTVNALDQPSIWCYFSHSHYTQVCKLKCGPTLLHYSCSWCLKIHSQDFYFPSVFVPKGRTLPCRDVTIVPLNYSRDCHLAILGFLHH